MLDGKKTLYTVYTLKHRRTRYFSRKLWWWCWATPTGVQGVLCLSKGHLSWNVIESTLCSFSPNGLSSHVVATDFFSMCRSASVGVDGEPWTGGFVGWLYLTSLTKWIAPLGCTLEEVQGCVRGKVWLGLVNRHPLYQGSAAASHKFSETMDGAVLEVHREIGCVQIMPKYITNGLEMRCTWHMKYIAMGWIAKVKKNARFVLV